mmetsp:Transcript_854/g.3541  ORF Transcript_854/g.3541 Transcript_854/m.3541 type:complete len:234 (-) Transcript_854:2960-3661(-)
MLVRLGRNCVRESLVERALPQARLEEATIQNFLQLDAVQGQQLLGVAKKRQHQGDPEIRHGEILQQKLGVTRAQNSAKRWELLQVQHVILTRDLRPCQPARVRARGRSSRLRRVTLESAKETLHSGPLVAFLLRRALGDIAVQTRANEAAVESMHVQRSHRIVVISFRLRREDARALDSPLQHGIPRPPGPDLREGVARGIHQHLEHEDDVPEGCELGVVIEKLRFLSSQIEG